MISKPFPKMTLPNGGDHEVRKAIAERLLIAAEGVGPSVIDCVVRVGASGTINHVAEMTDAPAPNKVPNIASQHRAEEGGAMAKWRSGRDGSPNALEPSWN
ncbi:hypothetical protein [Bradyrhizobium sp. BR 1432]|uniref:hypothetical protein n=1 Tax=Bradyrhizobium sp. BR 1432 TaxID=3447966 RepID=UPI003EE51C8C